MAETVRQAYELEETLLSQDMGKVSHTSDEHAQNGEKGAPAIAETASFYSRNIAVLTEVVTIFGINPEAVEDLDSLVEATQPWVRGDHARPEHRANVTNSQSRRLHELYNLLGIRHAKGLSGGHYEYIVGLGGLQRGNMRRMNFLRQMMERDDVNTDHIVLLGGERVVYPETESAMLEENIQELQATTLYDPVVKKIVNEGVSPRHETDMIRMAAALRLKDLVFKRESGNIIEFDRNGTEVTLIHTKAVSRPNGEPRHTTEACMVNFVNVMQPLLAARVGFVATNPHTERTTRSAQRIITNVGRGDVVLEPSGPGALDSYEHELYRGEIARLLYEDQLQIKSRDTNSG